MRDTLEQERGSRAEGERKSAVGQSYGMTEGLEEEEALGCKSESDGQTEKKEECSRVRRDHKKDRMGGRFRDRALQFQTSAGVSAD